MDLKQPDDAAIVQCFTAPLLAALGATVSRSIASIIHD